MIIHPISMPLLVRAAADAMPLPMPLRCRCRLPMPPARCRCRADAGSDSGNPIAQYYPRASQSYPRAMQSYPRARSIRGFSSRISRSHRCFQQQRNG